MFIMGQTSRCCMVCLMPQSQVSVSFELPHFDMITLDRPACVRMVKTEMRMGSGCEPRGTSEKFDLGGSKGGTDIDSHEKEKVRMVWTHEKKR